MKRWIGIAFAAAFELSACSVPARVTETLPHATGAAGLIADTPQFCEQRSNDTLPKLEECIRRESLWHRLAQFQQIADRNPGPDGHANRNTGTPGYAASVDYVASLMRRAGYRVTLQRYNYRASVVTGTSVFRTGSRDYAIERDWFVARRSGSGTVTSRVEPPHGSGEGCSPSDFAGFTPGNIALLQLGSCAIDRQVENAQAAGAAAAILFSPDDVAYEASLTYPAAIPVIGAASNAVGTELLREYRSGAAPSASIQVRTHITSGVDDNLIADSPWGDPDRVVVVDAHLDSIYGAGMLDNASGSTTALEVALNMARTPTRNRLRFIWFGGEELGLLGSHYYTKHLTPANLRRIVFDIDVDVTATPNFDISVADPAFAWNVKKFPANVVPESKRGNDLFADFFTMNGALSRPAQFGNNGTDSNSFSLAGVPNTGILTQQDCCKHAWETRLWGGVPGNYEGELGSFNGGCVDMPHRWCDNLANNNPFVLELTSKAVAYVTFELANAPIRR